jgi:hypothetical protein
MTRDWIHPTDALRTVATAVSLLGVLAIAGCATIGQDFPDARVSEITIGKTTMTEVQAKFGEPWRVGVEDGERKWTYGRYRYSMFGSSRTKDLAIRFDERNVVSSYSYNTTERDEK